MQQPAMDRSTIRLRAAVLWAGCLCILLAGGCAGKDSGVEGAEDAVAEAKQSIRVSDFAAAYDLLAKHPPSENDLKDLRAEWYFLSGISAWHRVPPSPEWQEAATGHLERLVEQVPESPLAAQGAYTLGRILEVRDFAEDTVDPEAARGWYERCMAEWPQYVSAVMARFRLAAMDMNAYTDPDRMARGVENLDRWLQQNREHELAPVAALFLAQHIDVEFNDPESAFPYYLLAEELGWVAETLVGHRRWRIAEIAESLGKVDVAVDMYQKIIRENLQSARGYESQKRLRILRERHPERAIDIPPLLPMNMEEES